MKVTKSGRLTQRQRIKSKLDDEDSKSAAESSSSSSSDDDDDYVENSEKPARPGKPSGRPGLTSEGNYNLFLYLR
jgi:hypothetical protein